MKEKVVESSFKLKTAPENRSGKSVGSHAPSYTEQTNRPPASGWKRLKPTQRRNLMKERAPAREFGHIPY
jgi:hypothetical protein